MLCCQLCLPLISIHSQLHLFCCYLRPDQMASVQQASAAEITILRGTFRLHQKTSSSEYNVVVTKHHIILSQVSHHESSKKKSANIFKFSDIVGCDVMKDKPAESQNAFLNIYMYPHHSKLMIGSKKTLRKRKDITLVFSQSSSFDENYKEASRWQLVLSHLIRKLDVTSVQGLNI